MDSTILIAMKHKVLIAWANTGRCKPDCTMMENYISIHENALQLKITWKNHPSHLKKLYLSVKIVHLQLVMIFQIKWNQTMVCMVKYETPRSMHVKSMDCVGRSMHVKSMDSVGRSMHIKNMDGVGRSMHIKSMDSHAHKEHGQCGKIHTRKEHRQY